MIETFVRQRFVEPEQWSKGARISRQGTNPGEKGRYLDRICDIVGRMIEKSVAPQEWIGEADCPGRQSAPRQSRTSYR